MLQSKNNVVIRKALASDTAFILSLSPSLAKVAELSWHKDVVVQQFQDEYILEMLEKTDVKNITLIAEIGDDSVGFIHARQSTDDISCEDRATVPLLAVSDKAQGMGTGKLLMAEAESWAIKQGHRLIHLEVFSANNHAQKFYENLGFKPETLHMIKSLDP